MTCVNCGGTMVGDGYTTPKVCENVQHMNRVLEPDASPVFCEKPNQRLQAVCIDDVWYTYMYWISDSDFGPVGNITLARKEDWDVGPGVTLMEFMGVEMMIEEAISVLNR